MITEDTFTYSIWVLGDYMSTHLVYVNLHRFFSLANEHHSSPPWLQSIISSILASLSFCRFVTKKLLSYDHILFKRVITFSLVHHVLEGQRYGPLLHCNFNRLLHFIEKFNTSRRKGLIAEFAFMCCHGLLVKSGSQST